MRGAGARTVPRGLRGDRYRIPLFTPGYRNLHRAVGSRALRDLGVSLNRRALRDLGVSLNRRALREVGVSLTRFDLLKYVDVPVRAVLEHRVEAVDVSPY